MAGYFKDIPPPFAHQTKSTNFIHENKRVFDFSDPGCVSADTEYLTPTGWKRIDTYTGDDLVAQFHPDTKNIEFVPPTAYIKRPCDTMIAITPSRGVSQRVSHEHRVLSYAPDDSWAVHSAAKYMAELHKKGAPHFKRKFAITFNAAKTLGIGMTNQEIRIMVAVIADGHFPYKNPTSCRCVVNIKKNRKQARLRKLLNDADIEYTCIPRRTVPGYEVFTFDAPKRDKVFSKYYWGASPEQLSIFADELPHWDGSIDKRNNKSVRFSSSIEASADFAQYAFAANGASTSVSANTRERRGAIETEYNVRAYYNGGYVGPGRKESVYETPNPEGFKYCFEVPSSFLLLRHNKYIFATGNTGKTRSSIDAIKLHREDNGGKVIVTAPKSILQSAWGNDIDTFCPGLRYSVASAKNREEAFNADVDIVITNHDAVKWAFQNKKVLRGFDGVINDESTAFKHRTSQRSKQLYKLIKHFDFQLRVNLTGTPNPNTVLDLWHQVLLLDDGEHLGNSYFKFRNAVCEPVQTGPRPEMVQWVDREGSEEAVADILEDMTIRNKFEDCTDIPKNAMHIVPFTISRKHRTQYETLRDDALLELKSGTVTAFHAASLTTKLLQIASGAVYDEDRMVLEVNNDRAELVIELAAQREQCVIAFNWKHQRDALVREAEKRGFTYAIIDGDTKDGEVPTIVERFQAGMLKIIFAQPQSAAHGLTLTKGTTTIWTSPTYNAEHFNQFNRRIYRTGQTRKTETLMVCATDTLEESVYEKLQGKVSRMTNLLDLLQTSTPMRKVA